MSEISSVFLINWPWSLLFFQSCYLLVCHLCLPPIGVLLHLILLMISMLQECVFPDYSGYSGEVPTIACSTYSSMLVSFVTPFPLVYNLCTTLSIQESLPYIGRLVKWYPSFHLYLLRNISILRFSIPNSMHMTTLNILTVCVRESRPLFVFPYNLRSSIYSRWLIRSLVLLNS